MRVLLLEEDSDVKDKLSFALESKYHATVDAFLKLEDALNAAQNALLKAAPYSLLVCDYRTSNSVEFEEFQKKTAGLPTVLCYDAKKLAQQGQVAWNVIGTVDRNHLLTNLFQVMDHHLVKLQKADANSSTHEEHSDSSEFCKIKAKILLSVCPLRGDVFIRLSNVKYVKLFKEGDAFEKADWIKYSEQKGIDYLYIKLDQCEQFIEKYRQDLEKHLSSATALEVGQATTVQNSVHETVQEMAKRIGFTKDVQVLAKTQIRIAVRTLKKNPTLAGLLEKLELSQGSYIASHSTLTGYLSSAIASQMEWGSEATIFKLNLAAFLHDITLDNNDLAMCQTMANVNAGAFSEAEKNQFHNHCMDAAKIAQTFTEVPPDVDAIILQHHEISDGTGFPRGISATYISPLSSIFIVAHEMARFILVSQQPFSLEAFHKSFGEKFSKGNFRKVMEATTHLRLEAPSV